MINTVVISEEIQIVLLLFLILIIMIVSIIWWYRKNNLMIEWVQDRDGANIRRTKRARVSNKDGRFYSFGDYFNRKPIAGLEFEKVKDYFIISESSGFFAPKLILKLVRKQTVNNKALFKLLTDLHLPFTEQQVIENKDQILLSLKKRNIEVEGIDFEFFPYKIPLDKDNNGLTSDYNYAFCLNKRVYLYEITKTISRAEMMARILLPLGLIVLAIFLIIYYPTLYDKITSSYRADAVGVLAKWAEVVTGTPPPGG